MVYAGGAGAEGRYGLTMAININRTMLIFAVYVR